MDLYGSDLRLSDIGLGEDQVESEYPLDMLDHHLGSPYSTALAVGERTRLELTRTSSGSETASTQHGSATAHGHNDLMDFHLTGSLDNNWLDNFLDDGVFHDTLLPDTYLPAGGEGSPQLLLPSGAVKCEHSYSLADAANNPLDLSMTYDVKLETDKDVDAELFETIDQDLTVLSSSDPDDLTAAHSMHHATDPDHSSVDLDLKDPASPDLIPMPSSDDADDDEELIDCVKEEPQDAGEEDCTTDSTYTSVDSGVYDLLALPPTPPCSSSSGSSSDSEAGGLTPTRLSPPSPLNSPYVRQMSIRHSQNLWSTTLHQPVFNNPISSNGIVFLTEEEKRTLIAEGYPLPTKLPLSKQEEKNLKKIRRKIKNKISAQESRRKKKEYLETLEKKIETVSQENSHLKKKVDILETNNRSLVSQLQRLQGLANKMGPSQTGTCVMVN